MPKRPKRNSTRRPRAPVDEHDLSAARVDAPNALGTFMRSQHIRFKGALNQWERRFRARRQAQLPVDTPERWYRSGQCGGYSGRAGCGLQDEATDPVEAQGEMDEMDE